MISKYSTYTTSDGLPGVKVRVWHPAWFIPMWKMKIGYWVGVWRREAIYKDALISINMIIEHDRITLKSRMDSIREVVEELDCGFECAYVDAYGFVPEDGCPIHDNY